MGEHKSAWQMVRAELSLLVAGVVALFTGWLTWITGGTGAMLLLIPGIVGSVLFAVHRRKKKDPNGEWSEPKVRRHEIWAVAKGIVLVCVVWNGVSFVKYVAHDNGDTLSQRAATWARNHGMNGTIDYLEAKVYSTPPSKDPAKGLAVVEGGTSVPDASPGTTTPGGSTPASNPNGGATTSTAPTTTEKVAGPAPAAPTDLTPVFSPPLAGEGKFSVLAKAGGQPAMWLTGIRPLQSAGGVVGTVVVIDQTYLRSGLFNGSEEPGGTWQRGNKVPTELQPALVAAMNGGFRLQHIKGGYVTEGRVVKPLKVGDATMAVSKDGKLVIGALGREIKDDGSWLSLRQNLMLIVDGGQSQVQRGIQLGVWWGADFGNKVYVNRSGICQLKDGRLAYALIGKVDAEQFAQSLINIGCVKAMQLDINGTWPNFDTYTHNADGSLTPHLVDDRMGTNLRRYLKGSSKEFIAFFNAEQVPAKSVLDV